MKFKFRHLEKIVGAFIILSILTLLVAVIAIGRAQNWFEKNFSYRAIFTQAAGINPGSAVQMMGINIGEVTAVNLNGENQIEVSFKVREKYLEKIRSDSVARVASTSLLGGKVLELTVGSPLLTKVAPLSVLPAEEGGGLAELLKSGRLESILAKVDGIIFHVQELSEKLVASSDQLKITLTNLAVITDRLREGKGSAGRLLSEKEDIYQELLRSIQNTRESLENLKATSAEIRRASPEARRLLEQGETSLIEAQKVIRAVQKTWPLNRNIPSTKNPTRIQLDAREENYPATVTGP